MFEHVDQRFIRTSLDNIRRALKPDGMFFVQIAPLYYSARGAHLYSVDDEPWAHLTMQQDLLRARVFERAGDAAAAREIWGVYETLNKLTADELLDHLRAGGYEIVRELRTREGPEPPRSLTSIYHADILRTNQVVALARPKR